MDLWFSDELFPQEDGELEEGLEISEAEKHVLVNQIIPKLSINDMVNYCRVNKYIHNLCQDDYIWRNKALFRYGDTRKPPSSTWKDLYFDLVAGEFTKNVNVTFLGQSGIPNSGIILSTQGIGSIYDVGDVQIVPFQTTYRSFLDNIYDLVSDLISSHGLFYEKMDTLMFEFSKDNSIDIRLLYSIGSGIIKHKKPWKDFDFTQFNKVSVSSLIFRMVEYSAFAMGYRKISEKELQREIISIKDLADKI